MVERPHRMRQIRGSFHDRDRPIVVTAQLPNARQVRMSRVLRDDHYKGLDRVSVSFAR